MSRLRVAVTVCAAAVASIVAAPVYAQLAGQEVRIGVDEIRAAGHRGEV